MCIQILKASDVAPLVLHARPHARVFPSDLRIVVPDYQSLPGGPDIIQRDTPAVAVFLQEVASELALQVGHELLMNSYVVES